MNTLDHSLLLGFRLEAGREATGAKNGNPTKPVPIAAKNGVASKSRRFDARNSAPTKAGVIGAKNGSTTKG